MQKFFRKFHIYASVLFLPIALLYVISGVAYLAGFDQDSGSVSKTFVLDKSENNLRDEVDEVIEFFEKNNIRLPSDLSIHEDKKRGGYYFGSAKYSVSIKEAKENPEKVNVKTLERSFLGNLIMLHKSKAKWYFDILAYGFAFTLILLYMSGFIATMFCKKHRVESSIVLAIGFIVTFVVGYMSL